MICSGGDEPYTKSAALLVLMATLENAAHPKALANTPRHPAFNHCAEQNLCGIVDAEIRVLEAELFAGKAFVVSAVAVEAGFPLARFIVACVSIHSSVESRLLPIRYFL